jgi:pimeloyl-ACP methyl ester carboxylesterase
MMPKVTLGRKTGEDEMTKTMSLAGTTLELVERGQGRPLLFLHPGEGLAPEKPWLELLSRRYRVIAPWHPGYGNSPLIDGSGSVDDLAYLYLDLAAELKLENAVLVGACFGGWIAAEMMVRSTARFSHLVLVDPLGIKISGREERDIADMHALPRAEYLKLAWADPAKGDLDFTKLPERELAAIVCGVARPSRSMDGSPTCTIRDLNAGCIGLTFRLYCYGARRTASSRRPMARAGAKRYQEPGSRSFHRPATSLTGSSPKHSSNAFRPLSTKTARRRDLMRVWYFSEMAYHPAWEEGLKRGSLRVVLPNNNYDPKIGTGFSIGTLTSLHCVTRSASTSWSTSTTALRHA